MVGRSFRRNNKGQVIVISALLIALLILSTAIYIIETERDTPTIQAPSAFFVDYSESARNTLISALANASNGGNVNILVEDLAMFKAAVTNHSYQAMLQVDTTPANATPYQSGLWLVQGANGTGIASAAANFAFTSTSPVGSSQAQYLVNVSTQMHLNGVYFDVEGKSKDVNLTVNIKNDDKPALAKNFTVYFEYDGLLSAEEWVLVSSPNAVDFGNGTYRLSFNIVQHKHNDPVLILLQCTDQRGIFVQAIVECASV